VHAKKARERPSRKGDELLAHALRELAAVLLRLGINAPRAEKLLRAAFVQAAEAYARAHGFRITQSLVATLAGLNRIDVRKLMRARQAGLVTTKGPRNRIDRVISAWRRDPRFCTRTGKPRALSYGGQKSEFTRLAKAYGRDVTPKSILEQLTRVGAVKKSSGKLVQIRNAATKSSEANAAQADLQFLEAQLGKLRLQLGRREYAIRSVAVPVENRKSASRLQRMTLDKVELMLNALDSMTFRERTNRRTRAFRVIVTATVATESGKASNEDS